MALEIDLDGFGFLESDSEAKMPTFNKQPPISPIESESSSGISSLDSDDLKVNSFLLISTIILNIHLTQHWAKIINFILLFYIFASFSLINGTISIFCDDVTSFNI